MAALCCSAAGPVERVRPRCLPGEVIDNARLFSTKLHEWERFYTFARPHGALGGQTPTTDAAVDQALGVGEHRQPYNMMVLGQGVEP